MNYRLGVLPFLAFAAACNDVSARLDSTDVVGGALESEDVVFIGKKRGKDHGDFVVTADPSVTITRVDSGSRSLRASP